MGSSLTQYSEVKKMVDLLSMAVLPSAADIVNELIKGAVNKVGSEIMGQILKVRVDVGCECSRWLCREKFETDIGNHDHNEIECPNCHRTFRQFTNVCQTTLQKTGKIAHIGISLGPSWKLDNDDDIIVPGGEYLFAGLKGVEIVEKNLFRDFDSNKLLTTDTFIWQPTKDFFSHKSTLIAHWHDVPEHYKKYGRLFATDIEFRSRYNELLCAERDVIRWS